ncbi:hypothetical protein F1559_003357 [Cyanidiococcus yangmingshanensis]|uniref:Uncharacterized protein n=1 Tax=Cyanidiococcus yangmingshanensis TaxID=2690220 RepID=A0A7J7IID3_9RHOD|nr:hypothetical protein F1559_003357 [Cyanidiococcus yangmingshanensis]
MEPTRNDAATDVLKAGRSTGLETTRLLYLSETPSTTESAAFVSGFDLSTEEEQRRRALRTGLFERPVAEHVTSEVDPFLLPEGAVLLSFQTLERPRNVSLGETSRPEALHLYGVDRLSTRDLKRYFVENECIEPSWIEWINDSSCNAVFADEHTANWVLARLTIGPPIEPNASRTTEEDWLGIKRAPSDQLDEASQAGQHLKPNGHADSVRTADATNGGCDTVDDHQASAPEAHNVSASMHNEGDKGAESTARSTREIEEVTEPSIPVNDAPTPTTDPSLWWRPARPFPSSHNTWLPLRVRHATVMDVRPVKPNPHSAWSRSVRQSREQRRRSYPPATREQGPRGKRFSAVNAARRVHGHIQKRHGRYSGDRGGFRRNRPQTAERRTGGNEHDRSEDRSLGGDKAASPRQASLDRHRDVSGT